MLEYDRWANEEMLCALREHSDPPQRAMQILAHVVAVHHLFLSRIHGQSPPEVWPDPDAYDFEQGIQTAYEQWMQVITRSPDETIEYVNSKGESWTSRLVDIVSHVIIHSAYHRGQIALLIGQSGETPPYTDYIHCTRNNLI